VYITIEPVIFLGFVFPQDLMATLVSESCQAPQRINCDDTDDNVALFAANAPFWELARLHDHGFRRATTQLGTVAIGLVVNHSGGVDITHDA
jgi:hypothetical protein